MERTPRYPTDLTDERWGLVAGLLPPARPGGRRRTADLRAVLDAVLYVARTGCQWRALPADFPPWQTCYYYFRRFGRDGTWRRAHDALRARARARAGRAATPSAVVIDSQSVRTTERGGPAGSTRPSGSRAASGT